MSAVKPETESFEYHVRHLLARYGLSGTVQTGLGNEICRLARMHLGIDIVAPSGKHSRRFAGGNVVHYFPNNAELSQCGRLPRGRLQAWRIEDDPKKFATIPKRCTHCMKSAFIDSERSEQARGTARQLDSPGERGYTGMSS